LKQELKRRSKQEEKRTKEIDKKIHDICNDNQKLQQENSQKNNDYANVITYICNERGRAQFNYGNFFSCFFSIC
jgi:hypothetical protein